MTLQLYYAKISPPSNVVRILIKQIDVNVEEKELSFATADHMKPEFLSINPFHCVPTFVDDGYALWESRAICTYLVDKYAHGHSIYPTDLQKRATVDRWLYWDSGTFFPSLAAYFRSYFAGKLPEPESAEMFKKNAAALDGSLKNTKYVAGDKLTIADISIVFAVKIASALGIYTSELKNVEKWLKQMQADLGPETWQTFCVDNINGLIAFLKSKVSESS